MSPTRSGWELNLLAYNIWMRPGPFLDGQRQRARALARGLRGHDVVVLCEAFDRRLCGPLLRDLAQDYPHQTGVPGALSWPRPLGSGLRLWSSGVTILSRWPIVRTASRFFRGLLGFPDRHADKGAVFAEIDKQGRRFGVMGAHSQADPEPLVRAAYRLVGRDADAAFARLRLAHFELMRRFARELALPTRCPLLFAGDLNVDMMHETGQFAAMLDRLGAALPGLAVGELCTIDPSTNSLNTGPRRKWLDYVLWSRDHREPTTATLEARRVTADRPWRRHPLGRSHRDCSDHHAVVGRFCFESAPVEGRAGAGQGSAR